MAAELEREEQIESTIGGSAFTTFFSWLLLAVGAIVTMVPFVWMVLASFKTPVEIMRIPPTWWPQEPTLQNFTGVLQSIAFGRYYVNTIYITVLVTAAVLFTSSLSAYIFAKYQFRGRDLLFMAFLASMMIPFQVVMIPLYKLMIDFGWVNTHYSLTIPAIVHPFGIFLMRQFMLKLPDDLIEAARIDGCSQFGIYRHVIVPLVKPAMSALGIFIFLWQWNDYLWPLIVIDSEHLRTLPLGLGMFIHQRGVRIDLLMAASLMTVVPPILVFIAAQKHFIRGIVLSGLKG